MAAMVAEAYGGHAHAERRPASKEALIQESDQEGPEAGAKQVHAAIGDGHRLPSHALGTVN
jgi:hypothetical protein